MNEIIHIDSEIVSSTTQTAIALPELPIEIRQATMDDLTFIDYLQKKNTKKVGFLPTKALEGKIKLNQVLIATRGDGVLRASEIESADEEEIDPNLRNERRIGYLIGNDQYYKRDDVGCIFQVNIAAGSKRRLVGASLLKAQFEASAWGCKLYVPFARSKYDVCRLIGDEPMVDAMPMIEAKEQKLLAA